MTTTMMTLGVMRSARREKVCPCEAQLKNGNVHVNDIWKIPVYTSLCRALMKTWWTWPVFFDTLSYRFSWQVAKLKLFLNMVEMSYELKFRGQNHSNLGNTSAKAIQSYIHMNFSLKHGTFKLTLQPHLHLSGSYIPSIATTITHSQDVQQQNPNYCLR